MKPKVYLRTAAVALMTIVLPHSLALLFPKSRGPEEAAVFESMRNSTFEIMGSTRSHFDFYHGYSIIMSLLLATVAVLLWQLAGLTTQTGKALRWPLVTLTIGFTFFTLMCWTNFFAAPAIAGTVATLSLALASWSLSRQA